MAVQWIQPSRFASAGQPDITDAFTRADSTTSLGDTDTGETWSALVGTWGISSNQAYNHSSTSNGIAVVDFGAADMIVEATGAARSSGIGLIARCTDADNAYLGYADGGGVTGIYKKVAGVGWTQLGALGTGTSGNGVVIKFSAVGSTLTLYTNGVESISRTDTDLASGTKGGLRCDNSTSRFDDFSIVSP